MAAITVRGARLHNLKNVSFSMPKNQLVVFTGPSGSDKSTMAFDTLHKEGRRQYLESLGLVTYESRPPVEAIVGLSPTISVDQHNTNRSPRSTVGTATEVYTYLRVLFARTGHRPCLSCGADVRPEHGLGETKNGIWDDDDETGETGDTITCPTCSAALPTMGMAFFSFNKPAGACPACTGLGTIYTARGAPEHNLKNITAAFPQRTLTAVTGVSGSGKSSLLFDILDRAARQRFYGAADQPGAHDGIDGWEHFDKVITIDQTPLGRSTRSNAATYTDAFTAIREVFATQPAAHQRGLTAQYFSFNVPGGRCDRCEGAGVLAVEMHFLPDVQVRCPACHGRRFKREVLPVEYRGNDIAQVLDLTIEDALALLAEIPAAKARLGLMAETGMGYLQLGQPASTFSGGEAQRAKLAKELARRSTGRTVYLLDEPTTGLHPADTVHLVLLLRRLVDAGNTVIVVEHNLDVVKCADWVIDLGPEGGEAGGQIIAAGTPETVAACPASLTGQLRKRLL